MCLVSSETVNNVESPLVTAGVEVISGSVLIGGILSCLHFRWTWVIDSVECVEQMHSVQEAEKRTHVAGAVLLCTAVSIIVTQHS